MAVSGLVDTGGILALLDSRDSWHAEVIRFLRARHKTATSAVQRIIVADGSCVALVAGTASKPF